MSVVLRISEPGCYLYFTVISSNPASRSTVAKRCSPGWQIGSLPQESIGDDELVVTVARMRAGTVDHSTKKPPAAQRRDRSQLVVTRTADIPEVLGQRAVSV